MSGKPVLLRLAPVLLAGAIAVLAASGCGADASAGPGAAVAAVTERDFEIKAPTSLKAGDVVLHVANEGPDYHELIIAPLRGASLPLRADGFTVDEESIEDSEPGVLEPGRPHADRALRVHLAPGRYVFFCNMAGHYEGGMHAIVDVTR